MTDNELLTFLEENQIGVGDLLQFKYFRLYPEIFTGNVVLKNLQQGSRVISTQLGPLSLPENKLYLILHNNIVGVYGVSSQFISNMVLIERRGITPNLYHLSIQNQSIVSGCNISYVDIDDNVQFVKIIDTKLQKDFDGDEYFIIHNGKGIFNCYLQGIKSLKKV